jgi:hypothetical protein
MTFWTIPRQHFLFDRAPELRQAQLCHFARVTGGALKHHIDIVLR